MIFSHVLYQLSYLGVAPAAALGDRRAIGAPPYGYGARLSPAPFQSSSAGGSAGGPGTA
jgi:hypothetical protein